MKLLPLASEPFVALHPRSASPSSIDTRRTASWTTARRRAWWSLRSKSRRAEAATFIPGALQTWEPSGSRYESRPRAAG